MGLVGSGLVGVKACVESNARYGGESFAGHTYVIGG
jgi:hypothetical protein